MCEHNARPANSVCLENIFQLSTAVFQRFLWMTCRKWPERIPFWFPRCSAIAPSVGREQLTLPKLLLGKNICNFNGATVIIADLWSLGIYNFLGKGSYHPWILRWDLLWWIYYVFIQNFIWMSNSDIFLDPKNPISFKSKTDDCNRKNENDYWKVRFRTNSSACQFSKVSI